MRMRNYLGFLALLIFSGPALSADYYWRGNSINGATPAAVCTSLAATPLYPTTDPFVLTAVSPTQFSCKYFYWADAQHSYKSNNTVLINRYGDACPSGSTYNDGTGACDVSFADQGKPCPDQSGSTSSLPMVYDKGGQCVRLDAADQETTCKHLGHISLTKQRVRVRGTINDQGEAVPPPAFKALGCAADVNATTAQCTIKPASMGKTTGAVTFINPPTAVCTVDVKFNGQVASDISPDNLAAEKNELCLDETKCNLPEPQQSTEKKPCTYVSAPDGSQTCVSTSGVTKEGKTQCGTVNGVLTCSDSMAKPIGNGMIVWTKVNSEGLGDGKTKVTKTDTMTSYTCGSGKSTCTSSTSTSTTVTIKDGNGNTESVTGSCTGSACPDKNGNPDGDGDGFGDCVGDDCGDEATIGGQDWYEKGDDTYSSVIGEFADGIKQTPVVSGLDNFLTVSVGGNCPVWQVSVWVFDIRLDQWCQPGIPWELIRAVVLACAAFLAFRIAFQ